MNETRIVTLAVSMGDPAGIGPEVIAGSWPSALVPENFRRVVIGRVAVMNRAIELLELPLVATPVATVGEAQSCEADRVPVLEIDFADADAVAPGINSSAGGHAAFLAVELATQLALSRQVDAIVTAPLSKKALHQAGHTQWPGHTEMLADLCGVPRTAMMLYLPPRCAAVRSQCGLGVIHTTLHTSMRLAIDSLTRESILETARLATAFAADMLAAAGEKRAPRIGVAALNPHAGEEGMFGDEEIRIIAPAVEAGKKDGLPLTGPLPCDTLMHRAADGEFDCIVAMYHDQGHIALKLLGLHQAVNVTLGLPIVRTSVAHGTAYDIAWKGKARSGSMAEALLLAGQLANLTRDHQPSHGRMPV